MVTNIQPLTKRQFAQLHGSQGETRRLYFAHLRRRIAAGKPVDPEDMYALKLSERAKNRRRK